MRSAIPALFLYVAAQLFPASAAPVFAAEQGAVPSSRTLRLGKTTYKSACSGCHKWHGAGGGGYGGAAASLRATHLDLEQLIEVIKCGRPGTGMPSHVRDPYKDGACYGITKETPGIEFPMEANAMLRPDEVEAVAEYVKANLQGKGDPALGDCEAYWGPNSHNCREFKPEQASPADNAPPSKESIE
jgi:mono/diheme cytochrome c family protein